MGDRVVVLHNIILGNLIGTVNAIHERPKEPVYEVELDSLDMDLLYGFQLQTLESKSEGIAAGTADEKPDGQVENDLAVTRGENVPPSQAKEWS